MSLLTEAQIQALDDLHENVPGLKKGQFVEGDILLGDQISRFPNFTDATRPDASLFRPGTPIYNTGDSALNISDGTVWRDALGTLT